jgi:FkbM family methyltransferase
MNYTVAVNYTESLSIALLSGNDKLSHKETFRVTRNGRSDVLTYCCSSFKDKAPQTPNPLYSNFFNSFLNVNERFIKEGDTALDIGAYDGDTALPIAYLCGPTGKTYSFECGEAFMSQLSVNVGFNPSLNIEGIPAALMPKSGIEQFLYCATDYNGGHPSTNSWVGTYTVPRLVRAISFEDFSKGRDLSKLSFVKIDTEGHDFHILWSFKGFLKEKRPVIHAEWFPRTDPYIHQLTQFLDYRIFCGFTLEPVFLGNPDTKWRQDIILVPSEKVGQFGL